MSASTDRDLADRVERWLREWPAWKMTREVRDGIVARIKALEAEVAKLRAEAETGTETANRLQTVPPEAGQDGAK